MQIIKEQKIGDYYVSAVDISKDEWLEILKDKTVSEKYKEAVICFYYMPDYKGSCVAVGNRVGRNESPSHTTGRAVRHPAVRFNFKACWFM